SEHDDVEAAGLLAPIHQVVARRAEQAALLGAVHARRRTAEGGRTVQPHLHEHQRVAVLRDEIDFTGAAAVVARKNAQAAAFQPGGGQVLGSLTVARFHSSTICSPDRKMASHGRRSTLPFGCTLMCPVSPSSRMSCRPWASCVAMR